MSKKIEVKNTAWGQSYYISTIPVGEEHYRVRVEFHNQSTRDSKMLFKKEELKPAIKWLTDYTKDHNFMPLFDKFKEVVVDSPFNT